MFAINHFFILLLCLNACVCIKYTNYTLYRAIPVNESQIEFFKNVSSKYDINFWREPGIAFKPIEFVINPVDKKMFLKDAEKHNLYITTIIDDVQNAFDQQTDRNYTRRNVWESYASLSEINSWLKDIARIYPDEVSLMRIGVSHEGRDIFAVKVLKKGCMAKRNKIMFEGGIHAREWIAPAFVAYAINKILFSELFGDEYLNTVASYFEWYFVPVVNVDGYEYTRNVDRLWRKNRNGHGVDLNRNFGYAFGTTGVSALEEADTYCGPAPFSERESRALADFVKANSKNLKYYIAFHSYGQYMILPYANSKKHVGNFDEMYDKCRGAAVKLRERYNTKYTIGTAFDTVGYTSSGISGCWVKKTFKVPYVVTFELRDEGRHGFALPPELIKPTCEETYDGVLELIFPQHRYKSRKELSGTIPDRGFKTSERIVTLFNIMLFIVMRLD